MHVSWNNKYILSNPSYVSIRLAISPMRLVSIELPKGSSSNKVFSEESLGVTGGELGGSGGPSTLIDKYSSKLNSEG
jgi:hypothetical protein